MAYRILSPDGFDIECGGLTYPDYPAVCAAFERFKARYIGQGHYRTGSGEIIPLSDLADECQLIEA